jgi:hypothetical protein
MFQANIYFRVKVFKSQNLNFIMKIKEVIGFIFLGLGIIWSLMDKLLCSGICKSCASSELSPCYFLFLFVGIILVIDGVSLAIIGKRKKKKK